MDERYDTAREQLWQSSYNLEIMGDMLRTEARALREELRRLDERQGRLEAEDRLSQAASEMSAVAQKLSRDVEREARAQIDAVRDHAHTIQWL